MTCTSLLPSCLENQHAWLGSYHGPLPCLSPCPCPLSFALFLIQTSGATTHAPGISSLGMVVCGALTELWCMQQWVDGEHVLIGTKCNKLLCLNIRTQQQIKILLPDRPGRPAVLEAVSTPYKHCGMHCIAVSPDGQRVATGGLDPSDCQIFDVSEANIRDHMPKFTPGQTLMVRTPSALLCQTLDSSPACFAHSPTRWHNVGGNTLALMPCDHPHELSWDRNAHKQSGHLITGPCRGQQGDKKAVSKYWIESHPL